MEKISKIIDKNYIFFYIFLLLPFLEPAGLGNTDINIIFWIWKLISCLVLIIYALRKYKLNFSKIIYAIIGYECILIISTLINGGGILEALENAAATIIVSLLIEDSVFKIGLKKTLSVIAYLFLAFSIINLAEVLIRFDGTDINNHFLLGIDNRFIFTFLPMIIFSMLIEEDNRKILTTLSIVISFITLLYTKSIGALLGLILLIIYYIFIVKFRIKLKFINFKTCFILICILNFLLLNFNFQYIFGDYLGFLGKEVTLNGRIYLWEKGIKGFFSSPILGNGINTSYLLKYLYGYNHFHNFFLNILYQSGIIGFLAFIYFNLIVGYKLSIYKDNYYTKVITCALIVNLFLSLVDTLDYPFFYAFYVLAFHVDYLSCNNKKQKDVGVVTFFNSTSYGGTLQSLATLKAIEKLGKTAEFINYTNCYEQRKIKGNNIKQIFRNFVVNLIFFEWYWKEKAFAKNLILYDGNITSKRYIDISEMNDIQNNTLVVGSDQVWNAKITNGLDDVFLLNFGKAKNRFSYASSMGNYVLTNKDEKKVKECLKKFNYISVREDYAKDNLKKLVDTTIDITCDPTLLFTADEWDEILSKFDSKYKNKKENYILTFFVGGSVDEYNDYILYLKDKTNLPVYNIHKNKFKRNGVDKSLAGINVPEFVHLIKHSNYVMTDSFHGVVFSLLFGKKLIPLSNKSNPIRVRELLKKLDIEYLLDDKNSYTKEINYKKVHEKIELIRKKSYEWLKKSLEL